MALKDKEKDVVGRSIAVDLDGTIAQYDEWRGVNVIGDPIEGAREFLLELWRRGFEIIIFTTRTYQKLNPGYTVLALRDKIEKWLDDNDMPYNDVSIGGKPPALFYVDDRAVVCRPQKDEAAFNIALEVIEERENNG